MYTKGFPGDSEVKNPPAILESQEMWVLSLGWVDPLEEEMQPIPVFLPGKSPWQGTVHGVAKKLDTI